ncbi:hypothetical protein ACWCQZ_51130, partial [Streptomyces sp. NPDC002285]
QPIMIEVAVPLPSPAPLTSTNSSTIKTYSCRDSPPACDRRSVKDPRWWVANGYVRCMPVEFLTDEQRFGRFAEDPDEGQLAAGWSGELATCRKFAPAARNYTAAKLMSQVGLRVSEAYKLDLGDIKWSLGRFGKLYVRHGKGTRGSGPRERMVPLIGPPIR